MIDDTSKLIIAAIIAQLHKVKGHKIFDEKSGKFFDYSVKLYNKGFLITFGLGIFGTFDGNYININHTGTKYILQKDIITGSTYYLKWKSELYTPHEEIYLISIEGSIINITHELDFNNYIIY